MRKLNWLNCFGSISSRTAAVQSSAALCLCCTAHTRTMTCTAFSSCLNYSGDQFPPPKWSSFVLKTIVLVCFEGVFLCSKEVKVWRGLGQGRGDGMSATGEYHTGGKQLAQAHLGRLQQRWELTQVLRMSFLLAQSQTTLPLCYNLDSPVSCSSLNEFQKQTLPCEEGMRHCIGLQHGNILFIIISLETHYFLQVDDF